MIARAAGVRAATISIRIVAVVGCCPLALGGCSSAGGDGGPVGAEAPFVFVAALPWLGGLRAAAGPARGLHAFADADIFFAAGGAAEGAAEKVAGRVGSDCGVCFRFRSRGGEGGWEKADEYREPERDWPELHAELLCWSLDLEKRREVYVGACLKMGIR